MGVVSSCLGLDRQRNAENPETSRLLDDDSQQPVYGGIGQSANQSGHQIDPRDIERDRKALELIVEHSADNLIDLFALRPQPTHVTTPESKADQLGRRLEQTIPLPDTARRKHSSDSEGTGVESSDVEGSDVEDSDLEDEFTDRTTNRLPGRLTLVEKRHYIMLGEPAIGKKVIRGIKRE